MNGDETPLTPNHVLQVKNHDPYVNVTQMDSGMISYICHSSNELGQVETGDILELPCVDVDHANLH